MEQKNYNNMPICEEDEIDLRELFQTIAKYKYKIFGFTFIVVLLVTIYLISKPNIYQSKAILAPQGEKSTPSLGGLSALAGMAGISVGGGSGVDAFTSLKTILDDYGFEKYMIEKYDLIDKWYDENLSKDFVFAFGYDGLYKIFYSKPTYDSKEEALYKMYKTLQDNISLSNDKKTGIITLSVNHPNRFFAQKLALIYLDELTNKLREEDMQNIDKKIEYYKKSLKNTTNVELKKNLSQLISGLIQKKVLAKSNRYYNVRPITMPTVANIKDKVKPKRGLILVVSFVTSIILAIFGVFFIEFLRSEKEN